MQYSHYVGLLDDPARLNAFSNAIASKVRPGNVVLDVGAGVGTYAMMAALAGARKVYAVEHLEHIAAMGKTLARDNNLDDRIEWISADFLTTSVPERVDVAIYEDFEVGGLGGRAPAMLDSIRSKWLKPGGTLLPRRLNMMAALSSVPALIWRQAPPIGLNFTALRNLAVKEDSTAVVQFHQLMSSPLNWNSVDCLMGLPASLNGQGQVVAVSQGAVRSVVLWFEFDLDGVVRLAAGPSSADETELTTSWRQVILPVPEGLIVESGESLALSVEGVRGESGAVWWSWSIDRGRAKISGSTSESILWDPRDLQPPR